MTMTNQNRPTYNTTPHYVAQDYRSGKLKLNELMLLLWLRTIGNPFGVATTSLDALRDDIFPKLEKNTVNSILLKLRQKHHVFYERRQGQKGSFDIHLNHWMMPEKKYKTLDKFFSADGREGREENKPDGEESYPQTKSSEASQKSEGQNQKLLEQKKQLAEQLSANSDNRQIRSYHNEHDTEHQIENHDTLVKNSFNGTLVSGFNPTNHEEQRCQEIASELGEQFMNPILSVLRTDRFQRIEQAWGIYKEDRASGKHIDKPAPYFFGIIKKLRQNQ